MIKVQTNTTLPLMQTAFEAGTPTEKATFQSSVSGGITLKMGRPSVRKITPMESA